MSDTINNVPSQQERSNTTRAALIQAGRLLFSQSGYHAVSATSVSTEAGVSKGAFYHHFSEKRDLFRAVVEALEADIANEIVASAQDQSSARDRLMAGCQSFLERAEQPDFRQICMTDAPAVLGTAEWRRIDEQYGLGLISATLTEIGIADPSSGELIARFILAVLLEAAESTATSSKQERTVIHDAALATISSIVSAHI